jgi:uncharacterized protein
MTEQTLDPIPLLAGVALAGAAVLAIDAFLVEPARVEVTCHDLPLPGLPAAWNEARVVHLTDLHYGNPRSDRLFQWMVRTVNDLHPDLILITGDFVVEHPCEAAPCARYLSELRSKHGVVGVLGDHDFTIRSQRPVRGLVEGLEGAGVRLLRNESVELPGGLRIAGIDPLTRKIRRGSLASALGNAYPTEAGGKPHLLLAHSPDIIPEASKQGVPMVLCGHTHGGQVVVPFYGPPVTHTRVGRQHASGWSRRGDTRMYTCRGLASHHSLRFLCRPEIAVFRLVERET